MFKGGSTRPKNQLVFVCLDVDTAAFGSHTRPRPGSDKPCTVSISSSGTYTCSIAFNLAGTYAGASTRTFGQPK